MYLQVFDANTGGYKISNEAYEGDFYYNKHGGPISFYVERGQYNDVFKKYEIIRLPNSEHKWLLYKRFELQNSNMDLIILYNAGDIQEKSIGWFSDTLYFETQLQDGEGSFFNNALDEMTDAGRDAYILGWYAAVDRCKKLWEEFSTNE